MNKKKLYKLINGNEFIFGVCNGLADYTDIDVSIIRLIVVFLGLLNSNVFLLYLACAIIFPAENNTSNIKNEEIIIEEHEEI